MGVLSEQGAAGGARRSRTVAALLTVAAVALGVVLVRGGTAVDAEELARGGTATPSPTASAPDDGTPDAVLLSANGLPGLRLGAEPADGTRRVEEALRADGVPCGYASPATVWGGEPPGADEGDDGEGALARLASHLQVSAWLVDGRVVSVRLQARETPARTVDVVRSWAGVTLGSPVEVAGELPGARTTTVRPWPGEEPVTVVRVPIEGGGTELVVTDATLAGVPGTGPSGRVTSMELRTRAGAECTRAATAPETGTDGEPVAVAADGTVVGVRVGADAPALAASGALVASDTGPVDDSGCRRWSTPEGGVSVTSHDGLVTRVEAWGPFRLGHGVGSGSTAADLLASPLGPAVSQSPSLPPTGSVGPPGTLVESTRLTYVHLRGAVVELQLEHERRPVAEVGAWVPGGDPVLHSLAVLPPPSSGQDAWVC